MERFRFDERTSAVIEGDIVDQDGGAVPAGSLTVAELTLYDWETGTLGAGSPSTGIINDRDGQDILNTNNVTIDSAGHFIWSVQPADTIIVNTRRQVERHRAMFLFAWSGGEFRLECEIDVMNLRLQG